MYYILLFSLCFFFTFSLTPVLIKYLRKAKVVDLPGGRRIHKTVIPRMGGLLIYLVSSFILIYFSQDLNSSRFLMLASLLIFLVGVLDDTLGVNYQVKFIFQLIVAFLVVLTLGQQYDHLILFGLIIPAPFDAIILIFFITATINSINFLDGIDGLVSKSSILWFSTVLILSTIYSDQYLTLLSTCMLGSIIGFLNYNSYPARVFLGDTGSLSIGFYLVTSSLILSGKSTPGNELDMTFSLILLSVPLTDAFRVISQRMIKKRSPFLPDRTHIHHILLDLFDSQKAVVNVVEALTAVSCILAIIYTTGRHTFAVSLSVVLFTLIMGIKPVSAFLDFHLQNNYLLDGIKKHLKFIQKLIFGIISSLTIFFIIYLFSITSALDHTTSMFLLFLGAVAFSIAYTSTKKNIHTYEFFIFLNIIIALLITNLNNTLSAVNSVFSIFSYLFSINDFYVLSFLIIILLLSINISISLHFNQTWTDTITPLLLAIILTASFFIPNLSSGSFIVLLLGSLTIYMWIRCAVSYYNDMARRLSFFSFGLPFGILLKLLIS